MSVNEKLKDTTKWNHPYMGFVALIAGVIIAVFVAMLWVPTVTDAGPLQTVLKAIVMFVVAMAIMVLAAIID